MRARGSAGRLSARTSCRSRSTRERPLASLLPAIRRVAPTPLKSRVRRAMRRLAKPARALARAAGPKPAAGGVWLLRLSGRKAGVAVAYHRVGDPQGDPLRELTASLGTRVFAAHLHHLRRHYRVVPADELQAAVRARRRGEPFPVAITFDDDTRSHVDVAAPLLRALGLAATFFLTGAALDGPASFWWGDLQRALTDLPDVKTLLPAVGGIRDADRYVRTLRPPERERLAVQLASLVG